MSEEVTVTEVGNLSFKEGLEELAAIVRSLESNQIELEQSIESYERGVALLASLGELEPENDDSIDTTLS